MRKRPLVYLACVFLTGLVCQRYQIKGMAVVGLLLLLYEGYVGWKAKRLLKTAGRSMVLLSAFFLGILHMDCEIAFRDTYMSKISDGGRITVWGELLKIEDTDYGKRGLLSDCYIDFGEGIAPCNDIVVYTSKDLNQIGQIHKITGKVNMFSKARNEGNFDSLVYYQSLKIDFAVDEETCIVLEKEADIWKAFLLSIREHISQVYQECLSEKAAGFYMAMVLGNKIYLEESLKDLFLIGGISHILAISGLHVSILGRGMYRIMRRGGTGFAIAGICSGALLVGYGTMVGGSTSTIRAVGMLLIYFMAQWIGRSYDMLNAFGGMVLFLLWQNPFLIENSGFWFSVTALIGVGYVGESLDFGGLWMSLGITLTTLPVTALSYFEVPIYAPLVNFLVLPVLTPVFCLAFLGGVLGVWQPMRSLVGILLKPCEWLLWLYENVCSFVAKLPCATVICGKPEGWQVVLYYVILFGGVYVAQRLRTVKGEERQMFSREIRILLGTVCICVLCIFLPKSKDFEITFLDVGQGDGIYISAGDGTTYFIDGGSSNVNEVGTNRILPFLKSKGIQKIDYWFISHADSDHVSGLFEILEKGYKVEHIVLSELCSSDDTCDNLRFAARDAGVKILYMKTGDMVRSKNLKITCLGPLVENGEAIGKDKNENSLVLQVEWQQSFTALFAGDISTEIEEALCKKGLLESVELFKANHHGSNYSNGERLLEILRPEYIVVSCSEKNLYGHPGVHAVERMEDSDAVIFYTKEVGQITFPLIQYPYEND